MSLVEHQYWETVKTPLPDTFKNGPQKHLAGRAKLELIMLCHPADEIHTEQIEVRTVSTKPDKPKP